MNILFRTDSSAGIGLGHVMRCLTLADELKSKGAQIEFICADLRGHSIKLIEQKGYDVITIEGNNVKRDKNQMDYDLDTHPWLDEVEQIAAIRRGKKTADWVIVDHYNLDQKWESRIAEYAKKIFAIDDYPSREHSCDILLDQNYSKTPNRYDRVVPARCIKLIGPRYALLRPQFKNYRKKLRQRTGEVRRILVCMGGTDPSNETARILEAIRNLSRSDIFTDVVLGNNAPHKSKVRELCLTIPNVSFHCQVGNMAQLMANADLAVGASGSTTWERCCLGLPSIVTVIADNQKSIAESLHKEDLVLNLGFYQALTVNDYHKALLDLIHEPAKRKKMSLLGLKLVQGNGASIVAGEIMKSGDIL